MSYPYVVLRIMPAVYDVNPVQGLVDRQALVDRVLADCKRTDRSMCCVFGADDAVYCKPDGSTRASNEPPSGGAPIGPNRVTREG